MRIAVLVKQVPAPAQLAMSGGRLRRDGVDLEVNAYCRRANARAVELARAGGPIGGEVGEVVVLTMGPPSAEDALREMLACGADRAVHLCDPAFAGADTLATARALAAAVRQEGPFDLVLCGANAIDADTGQVGPELATMLGLPFAGPARELSVDGDRATARLETEDGYRTVHVRLPAVIAAAERLCDPSKADPAARREVAADRIVCRTAFDLGLKRDEVGEAGSPTTVGPVRVVETRRRRLRARSVDEAVRRLVEWGAVGAVGAAGPAEAEGRGSVGVVGTAGAVGAQGSVVAGSSPASMGAVGTAGAVPPRHDGPAATASGTAGLGSAGVAGAAGSAGVAGVAGGNGCAGGGGRGAGGAFGLDGAVAVTGRLGSEVWCVLPGDAPDGHAELVGEAARLAAGRDSEGEGVGGVAVVTPAPGEPGLHGWGADRVLAVAGDEPEDWAPAVAAAVAHARPWAVLVQGTAAGRALAAHVAARNGWGLVGDAIGFDLTGERSDRLVAWKPAFGGQCVAAIESSSPVQMATVRPGVLPRRRPRIPADPAEHVPLPVERLAAPPGAELGRVRTVGRERLDHAALEIRSAAAVVGVGQGVDPSGYPQLDRLRQVLGGAPLAATRKVTDRGWLPRSRQVGVTGRAIAPRLYVAVGVSGRFNHMVGVTGAATVLAIDVDPAAPVFEQADVGLVGDWREIVPALAEALARTVAPLAQRLQGADR